jgi:probable addiction module antidote protein
MTKAPRKTRKKTAPRTAAYDVAEPLRTPAEMAAYLASWREEAPDDVSGIARALGDIVRARGMTQAAKDAGLSRERLDRSQSADGNRSVAKILEVAKALGVRLDAWVA